MGSFSNAMFSVLLGWLRDAVAWLWQLVTNAEAGAWMSWVLQNWLPLTVLLCIAGLLADLVVYIIRWQPYRVWKRALCRLRHDEEPEENAESPTLPPVHRRWIYVDGSSAPVREDAEQGSRPSVEPEPVLPRRRGAEELDAPLRPVKRVRPARARRGSGKSGEYYLPDLTPPENTYNQPCYPPEWTAQEERGGER